MKLYFPDKDLNNKLNVERVKKASVLRKIEQTGYTTPYQ